MALNQEEFDTFVKRLESFARQKPGTYKIRVGLLAVLGGSLWLDCTDSGFQPEN